MGRCKVGEVGDAIAVAVILGQRNDLAREQGGSGAVLDDILGGRPLPGGHDPGQVLRQVVGDVVVAVGVEIQREGGDLDPVV